MPMPNGQPRGLKDAVPFREVHIHALVRDADRQKMSKTKGNVIDPIEIITRYGTDAVRFTFASMASPGTDIAFSEARTEGYRAFANKIWNAARFIFMQRDKAAEDSIFVDLAGADSLLANWKSLERIEDRWIASRLRQTCAALNEHFDSDIQRKHNSTRSGDLRFDLAASAAYQFFWGDFCDWYIEFAKFRLSSPNDAWRRQSLVSLLSVFSGAIRMLSPFMPFLTEEIWTALWNGNVPEKSVAFATLPPFGELHVELSAGYGNYEVPALQTLISDVRARRKQMGVPESTHVALNLVPDAVIAGLFPNHSDSEQIFRSFAKVSELRIDWDAFGKRDFSNYPTSEFEIVYEKPVDPEAELARLTKELAQQEKEFANNQRQLGNENFLAKAPAHVVEGLRTRAAELTALLKKNRAALADLESSRG
jgi:valyl-tRNA synthetase